VSTAGQCHPFCVCVLRSTAAYTVVGGCQVCWPVRAQNPAPKHLHNSTGRCMRAPRALRADISGKNRCCVSKGSSCTGCPCCGVSRVKEITSGARSQINAIQGALARTNTLQRPQYGSALHRPFSSEGVSKRPTPRPFLRSLACGSPWCFGIDARAAEGDKRASFNGGKQQGIGWAGLSCETTDLGPGFGQFSVPAFSRQCAVHSTLHNEQHRIVARHGQSEAAMYLSAEAHLQWRQGAMKSTGFLEFPR
jgi:hypothetical protein